MANIPGAGLPQFAAGSVTQAAPEFASNVVSQSAKYGYGTAKEFTEDNIQDTAEKWGVPSAFLARENKNRGLSSAVAKLLQTIDRTAQRTYIGHGFADSTRTIPNTRNIITQTPEAIVLIKKKMFSSLDDNYDPKYMDEDERHFMKASKKLFQNKCEQISQYEKLTKLNKLVYDTGAITSPIANLIYDTLALIEGTEFNAPNTNLWYSPVLNKESREYLSKSRDGIKKIRDVLKLNGFNQTTTWVGNQTKTEKQNPLGYGTGVIELTLVTNLSTAVSTELGGGSCSFSVVDPYRLFMIDEFDIEKALLSTGYTKFGIISYAADTLEANTEAMKNELDASRNSRGASKMTYKIDVTTRIYNKVTIILDRIGYEVTAKDGSGLDFETIKDVNRYPSYEQFTTEEQKLLKKIYKNLFKIQQIRMNDYVNYKTYNEKVNYTRKLMRQDFLGRQIIQPMDAVNIFIDSQTIEDKLISYGMNTMFSDLTNPLSDGGKNWMAAVSNTLGNGGTNYMAMLNNVAGKMKRMSGVPAGSLSNLDGALKNMLAGKDFPNWLWNRLRSNFSTGNFGTCVFCGVIERVSEAYNDNSYTLSVNAKDNSAYFEQGWINSKPSLNQFNGHLYDPLTPFDLEFDAATGLMPDVANFKLLPENRKILEAKKGITITDGKHAGKQATLKNMADPDVDESLANISNTAGSYQNLATRVYTVPDGFVYRWKRGIGTAIFNQSATPDGSMSSKLGNEDLALVAQENPFGGQDFVNVISILVCGEPYNFNNFFQSSKELATLSQTSSYVPDTDYFQNIFKRIKKQNKIWGNFIPFKKMSVDPEAFGVSIALQSMIYSQSTLIKKKQNQKAQLLAKLAQYEGDSNAFDASLFQASIDPNGTPNEEIIIHSTIAVPIVKDILKLDAEIQLHTQLISQAIRDNQGKTGGNVIAVGDNIFYDKKSVESKNDLVNDFNLTRAEQNELVKRRLWQAKANTDKNLFIVGNEYDSDYDIQTMSKNIASNFDFINTNWQTIKQKIEQVGITALGFEIFCNTQGHLELRTPKYNRVPSSVLYEMLQRKATHGIQIYPTFLEKMWKNKWESAAAEIETLEDNMRLYCIALGCKPYDADMETFLSGSSKVNGGYFFFTTDQNGTLSTIRRAVDQLKNDYTKQPDDYVVVEMTQEVQDFFKRNNDEQFNVFNGQAVYKKSQFDISKQIDNYNKITKAFGNQLTKVLSGADAAEPIRERLSAKLGIPLDKVPTITTLLPNSKKTLSPIDINTLQNKLQSFVARRYEALQVAVNTIKNLDSAARLNAPNSQLLSKLLMPNLFGAEGVPDFMRDMIEDETIDDYGLDAGKRFIIREKDIISMTYQEENPEFTSLEVSGQELGGLVGNQGFDIGGGIKTSNVYAVDYDLWRRYGFKSNQQKLLPFFSNPEMQLAPFAISVLNRERAKLITADITIRGNEYIQPGEVYYIQERGMLFYCKSVSHQFTYGGQFRTTMKLTFGRVPGEYIPTPLDVIGKNVYNGPQSNLGTYKIARSGTIGKTIGTNLGILVFPNLASIGVSTNLTPEEQLLSESDWGHINQNALEDIKGKISILATKTLPQLNSKFQGITVRVYSEDPDLRTAALYVCNLLQKVIPKAKIVGGSDKQGPSSFVTGEPMYVDITQKQIKSGRNPSNEAWNAARDIMKSWMTANKSNSDFSKDDVTYFISKHIIDIWIENSIPTNEQIIKQCVNQTDTNKSTVSNTVYGNMYSKYKQLVEASGADLYELANVKVE